mmetsp:Transcript_14899/g.21707  ORF Transcript_14899/g.21707 Transcript_14899/m.21707 type:complete len:81 (-) Transcript_14899:492-734(-)
MSHMNESCQKPRDWPPNAASDTSASVTSTSWELPAAPHMHYLAMVMSLWCTALCLLEIGESLQLERFRGFKYQPDYFNFH